MHSCRAPGPGGGLALWRRAHACQWRAGSTPGCRGAVHRTATLRPRCHMGDCERFRLAGPRASLPSSLPPPRAPPSWHALPSQRLPRVDALLVGLRHPEAALLRWERGARAHLVLLGARRRLALRVDGAVRSRGRAHLLRRVAEWIAIARTGRRDGERGAETFTLRSPHFVASVHLESHIILQWGRLTARACTARVAHEHAFRHRTSLARFGGAATRGRTGAAGGGTRGGAVPAAARYAVLSGGAEGRRQAGVAQCVRQRRRRAVGAYALRPRARQAVGGGERHVCPPLPHKYGVRRPSG